jgi:YHS domain-containing protein
MRGTKGTTRGRAVIATAALGFVLVAVAAAAPGRRADQEALKAFAPLVGSWRGVGQVERGRPKGAWQENAVWAWKLSADAAALKVETKKGKYLKSGILRPGKAPGTFVFDAILANGTSRVFMGQQAGEGKPLILKADAKAPAEGLRRVTLTPLHDTRLLVLLESEDPERHTFSRLGEVGYTREGVAFAAGESYPLCIVTEGRGTMTVTHKGKTYYVCCSGCRDLFNDDPDAVIAEAAAREKAKGAKK